LPKCKHTPQDAAINPAHEPKEGDMRVVEIGMVDVYRDGGSYGMTFSAGDGRTYEFFLEILPFEPSAAESHRSPVLFLDDCNNGAPVSRMSWDEAETFIKPLQHDDDRFRELVAIVARHGRKAG
jgi:hypothetical protein